MQRFLSFFKFLYKSISPDTHNTHLLHTHIYHLLCEHQWALIHSRDVFCLFWKLKLNVMFWTILHWISFHVHLPIPRGLFLYPWQLACCRHLPSVPCTYSFVIFYTGGFHTHIYVRTCLYVLTHTHTHTHTHAHTSHLLVQNLCHFVSWTVECESITLSQNVGC